MAITRRDFVQGALGAGALTMAGIESRGAMAQTTGSQLERNKAVALRFKKAQGTKEEADVMREVLSPGYKRHRGGMHHLAANAEGQGFPGNGSYLRGSFPDRRDRIDGFIAEKDSVWMRFRVAGTQTVSMYGIPPTGKVVEVAEIGTARFADGKWATSWYFGDELGMLLQLGLSPNILVS
jgi:predicted ester cyclase